MFVTEWMPNRFYYNYQVFVEYESGKKDIYGIKSPTKRKSDIIKAAISTGEGRQEISNCLKTNFAGLPETPLDKVKKVISYN